MNNFSDLFADMLPRSELNESMIPFDTNNSPWALTDLAKKLANENRPSDCLGAAHLGEKLENIDEEGSVCMDWHGGRYPRRCKMTDPSSRRYREVNRWFMPGRKKVNSCPVSPVVSDIARKRVN